MTLYVARVLKYSPHCNHDLVTKVTNLKNILYNCISFFNNSTGDLFIDLIFDIATRWDVY